MRKLKFRVWDKVTRSYSGGDLWSVNASGKIYYGNAEWPEGEVEQFTGLKDKKGVEIYEGDIVLRDNGRIQSEIVFGKIGFDNSWNGLTGFAFKDDYDKDYDFYEIWYGNEPKDLEVIGNTHEGVKKDG